MSDLFPVPPILDDLSREWFAASREERFLIQQCGACDAKQFYPRSHCAFCGSPEVSWLQSTGNGWLHTFSIVYKTPNPEFAPMTPYVFAIIRLEEGPLVSSRIVDTDFDALECELPVRVVFPRADVELEEALPLFTLRAN